MKYLEELKKLNLPIDQFAIFGSGPLAVRGLRENDDLDIVASEELWNQLTEKYKPVSDKEIKIGSIQIFKHWRPWFDDSRELIESADLINGVRFVNLADVKKWKSAMGREKDLADIKLIDKFQNEKVNQSNSF